MSKNKLRFRTRRPAPGQPLVAWLKGEPRTTARTTKLRVEPLEDRSVPAVLSGHVYLDVNANGRFDAADSGLQGVTVSLSGSTTVPGAVGTFLMPTTTDANGFYSFAIDNPSNLAFSIVESQPAGYLNGTNALGTAGVTVSGDSFTNISLAANQTGTGYDFGDRAPVTVNNSPVYNNTNTNTNTNTNSETNNNVNNNTNRQTQTQNQRQGQTQTQNQVQNGQNHNSNQHSHGNTNDNHCDPVPPAPPLPPVPPVTPAPLAGFVYLDGNGNGVRDQGDAGIPAVQVQLVGAGPDGRLDTSDDTSAVTETRGDGSYSFGSALPPGLYRIVELEPNGAPYVFAGPTRRDVAYPAAGLSEQNFRAVPAPLPPAPPVPPAPTTATLSGTVFDDRNGDGAQGPYEYGIAGATVTAVATADLAGVPLNGASPVTTKTGADGKYTFAALPCGYTYRVEGTRPAGFTTVTATAGTVGVGNVAAASGTVAGGAVDGVKLPAGAAGSGYHFGNVPAALAGYVFVDANNDGIRQEGEAGITGVEVLVIGPGSDGRLGTSDNHFEGRSTTDATGHYGLNGPLATGLYLVKEIPLSGTPYRFVAPTARVILGPSREFKTDFAAVPATSPLPPARTASLSGTVYGPDGAGLGGATVTATPVNNFAGGAVTAAPVSTTTGADGSYAFSALAGDVFYRVEETPPAGYAVGSAQPGKVFNIPGAIDYVEVGVATGNAVEGIPLGGGTSGTDYDFSDTLIPPPPLPPAPLAGYVFLDADGDGSRDPGEAGIPGATVQLNSVGPDGRPDSRIVLDEVSGADGHYSFRNTLPAGPYRIRLLANSGGPYVPEDAAGRDVSYPAAGLVEQNLGERPAPAPLPPAPPVPPAPTTASLSGTVYLDVNRNGVRDPGEPGLPHATVSLIQRGSDDEDSVGVVPAQTTTTGPEGTYEFSNLPGGHVYRVEELPLTGAEITAAVGSLAGPGVTDGAAAGVASGRAVDGIRLEGGVRGSGYDFANVPVVPAAGRARADAGGSAASAAETPAPPFRYEPSWRGGVFVGVGDFDDTGRDDILATHHRRRHHHRPAAN